MAFYHICPGCGACLDPGEKCDCEAVVREPMPAVAKSAEPVHHESA